MANRWKTVGKCAVDSGQIMFIDPCYVIPESAWSKFLQRFHKAEVDGAAEMNMFGVMGLGVVVTTAHGDGVYPVEARYNEYGDIIEVRISFD